MSRIFRLVTEYMTLAVWAVIVFMLAAYLAHLMGWLR